MDGDPKAIEGSEGMDDDEEMHNDEDTEDEDIYSELHTSSNIGLYWPHSGTTINEDFKAPENGDTEDAEDMEYDEDVEENEEIDMAGGELHISFNMGHSNPVQVLQWMKSLGPLRMEMKTWMMKIQRMTEM